MRLRTLRRIAGDDRDASCLARGDLAVCCVDHKHGSLTPSVAVAHEIRIRDLLLRYEAPEVFAAQCSCGWLGEERRGRVGERTALQDGRHHIDRENVEPRWAGHRRG